MLQEDFFRPPVVTLQFFAPFLKCNRIYRAFRMGWINDENVPENLEWTAAQYLRLWNEIDRTAGSGGWKRTLEPAVLASISKPMSIIT
jgi:hypothetical protein